MKLRILLVLLGIACATAEKVHSLAFCEVYFLSIPTGVYYAPDESFCNCYYAVTPGPFQEAFNYCTSVEVLGKKKVKKN